jgi:hypothetical protein
MATQTDHHGSADLPETPSQGIFFGWLALGLAIFAVLVAAFAIIAGAVHGFA